MVLEKFRKGVSLSCLPSSLTTVFGYPSKAEIDHGALIVLAVVVDYTLATNENCEKVSTKISIGILGQQLWPTRWGRIVALGDAA